MKVIEDDSTEDKYGICPLVFAGYKSLAEIHDYLWTHYQGYRFVIMLDESGDEYVPYGPRALVYFADTVLDELAAFYDKKLVKDDRLK